MGNWMQAVGAALISGSNMAARTRLDKIDEQKRNEDRTFRDLQAALMREQGDRATEAHNVNMADADLNAYGPNGEPDDAAIARIIRGGRGGRLSAEPTAEPQPMLPDDTEGLDQSTSVTAPMPVGRRSVLPTYSQRQDMAKDADVTAARARRDQALAQIGKLDPKALASMPYIQANDLWQRAHGSNLPEDPAQRMNEIIRQGQTQLAVVEAQGANQQELQGLKLSGNATRDFASLYRQNTNMLTQLAVAQQYATGKAADMAAIAQQAEALTNAQLKGLRRQSLADKIEF